MWGQGSPGATGGAGTCTQGDWKPPCSFSPPVKRSSWSTVLLSYLCPSHQPQFLLLPGLAVNRTPLCARLLGLFSVGVHRPQHTRPLHAQNVCPHVRDAQTGFSELASCERRARAKSGVRTQGFGSKLCHTHHRAAARKVNGRAWPGQTQRQG